MPGGRFIAVGHDGLRLVSGDGNAWTRPPLGKEGETWRAVAVGDGVAAAVGAFGGSNIFTASRDGGATWTAGIKDAKYSKYLRGVTHGAGGFLALGGDPGSVGSSEPFVMTSRDGVTWSDPVAIGGKHILRRVAHGGGLSIAVGDRGRRALSKDGKVWTDVPNTKPIDTLVDIAFGKNVFVGVGLHGLRLSTTDGVTWSERQIGEEGEHLNSVLWTGDRFVAIGQGATWTSPDGTRWQRQPNTGAPQTTAYGDGVFIGLAWRGRILRSTDGVRWQGVHQADGHLEAVAFGKF